MAACADGDSEIVGGLDSEDTIRARECLRTLGIEISDRDDPWRVSGNGGRWERPADPLDAGESGLTARFLIAVGALVDGPITIEGRGRLPKRPMMALIEAMSQLGVRVTSHHPWRVEGTGSIGGGRVDVDGSESSQVISALLLIGPFADAGLAIAPVGDVVSSPYINITVALMREFQVAAKGEESGWQVGPSEYRPARIAVPVDASALVYPAAAAAISGGVIEIHGDPGRHPDMAFLDVLSTMGCAVQRGDSLTTVTGPPKLAGLNIDMSDAPDAAVALAVLCAVADGDSRIGGLGSLRLKESDRLAALQSELAKVGAVVEIVGDSLMIVPATSPTAGRLDSHGDHRLAMSLALLGLVTEGISVSASDSVAKTWPGFWDWFATLGCEVSILPA